MEKYITELSPTTARLTYIEDNFIFDEKGQVVRENPYKMHRYFRAAAGHIFEYWPDNSQRGEKAAKTEARWERKETLFYDPAPCEIFYKPFLESLADGFKATIVQEVEMEFYIWTIRVKMTQFRNRHVEVEVPRLVTMEDGSQTFGYEIVKFCGLTEDDLYFPIQTALTAGDAKLAIEIANQNQEKSKFYKKRITKGKKQK